MNKDDQAKLTLLIDSLGGGGAEGVCVNLANGLSRRGWDVTVVVLHLNDAVHQGRLDGSVELVVLGASNVRYAIHKLRRYIKLTDPRLFLVFNYELAVLLVVLRILTFGQFLIAARNVNALTRKRRNAKGAWRRFVVMPLIDIFYSKVDCVINQCTGMRDDLLSLYPSVADRCYVINNPVDPRIDYEAAVGVSDPGAAREGYLLCMGRLEPQKALHYAIEAFSIIAGEYAGLRLKLVGKGTLREDLSALASELKVLDRVDFEGFQRETAPYYKHAQATLMTSLYEGFPNVLIESIALGTPVVAFDCRSGPSEIIEPGVNGYLVPEKDLNGLVAALRKVLDNEFDPDVVRSTAEKYRLAKIVSRYEEVLEPLSVRVR